jgi:DNA-binding LacI/PurR family transcriptional regulator
MRITDVAKEAGVSIATVSRVLNDTGYPVRAETRERVLAAVEKLGFRPNDLARGLLLKKTRTVGLIVPDILNPYYPAISRGVEDVASAALYAVIFCNTDRDAAKSEHYVNALLQKRVDGVIVAGGGTDFSKASQTFAEYETRVVFIGRSDVGWPSVQVDNVEAGRTAAGHLALLGHRRIALVTGPTALTSVRDRLAGYRQALADHGLAADAELVREGDFAERSGYEAASALLELPAPPTAIFAANDRMAIGALAAAVDRGVRVPRDLSIVGCDDIPLASYSRPALTTVAMPVYDMGASAMRLMLERLEAPAGESGAGEPPVIRLQTDLVIRASSAPPKRPPGGPPPAAARPTASPSVGTPSAPLNGPGVQPTRKGASA